jgi:hypothetical protein
MNIKTFSFGIGIILGTALYQIIKLAIVGLTDYIGIAIIIVGSAITFYGLHQKTNKVNKE